MWASKHNNMSKSVLRHILTALGAVMVFIGLGKWTGLTDILLANLDAIWAAVSTISGVIVTLVGFFKGRSAAGAKTSALGLTIDRSMVRHILTGIGAILAFLGLGEWTGLTDILLANLDAVWESVTVIVGAVIAVWGYFTGRQQA